MNIQKANKELFAQAKALRMCDEVHKAWYGKTLDVDDLAGLFYRNMDFCIDYRWPSRETLKNLFEKEDLRRNGIIVDDKWSLMNPTFATTIGQSRANIRFNGFSVGKVCAFNDSACIVTVKGHAKVIVHLYDKAFLSCTTRDSAQVTIMLHSENCLYSITGQATIKECT